MPDVPWWKSSVIYEIYPRSFQDTDADGVGDLRASSRALPYLIDLGVDAIWICPIFPSPMADFGYDVASYVDIDPLFGTFARLRCAAYRGASRRREGVARSRSQPHLRPPSVVCEEPQFPRQRQTRLVSLARRRTRRR
jgi:hypothetical protein